MFLNRCVLNLKCKVFALLNCLSTGTTGILLRLIFKINHTQEKILLRTHRCTYVHLHGVLQPLLGYTNIWLASNNPGPHRLLICNAYTKSIYQCTDSRVIFRSRLLQKVWKIPCFYLPFLTCRRFSNHVKYKHSISRTCLSCLKSLNPRF